MSIARPQRNSLPAPMHRWGFSAITWVKGRGWANGSLGGKRPLLIGLFVEGHAFRQVTLGQEVSHHVDDAIIVTQMHWCVLARPARPYSAVRHAKNDSAFGLNHMQVAGRVFASLHCPAVQVGRAHFAKSLSASIT